MTHATDTTPRIKWDARSTVWYPAACILTGLAAGMLGIDAGMVVIPLMLQLGLHPAAALASAQLVNLLSSSTSAILYASARTLPWDWRLIVLGITTACVGHLVNYVMAKKSEQYLGIVINVVSCVALVVSLGASVWVVALEAQAVSNGSAAALLQPGQLCT